MQLDCENCGAPFQPDRVSRKKRFAECAHCGTLHNIAEITASRSGGEYVPPPVFLPKDMLVTETDAGFEIEFNHINERATGQLLAGMIFLGGMALTAYFVWGEGSRTASGMAGVAPVARVMWLLAAAPMLVSFYLFVAGLVNRQRVMVTPTSVEASTGPLPVRPKRVVGFTAIRRVVARSFSDRRNGGFPDGYHVVLVTDSVGEFEIVSGFTDPEVADVMRHYILQAVGLEPRAVAKTSGATRMLFSGAKVKPPESGLRTPAKLELACACCGAPIPKDRIRKDLLAADCPQCGVIQDVRSFLRHGVKRLRRNPGFHPPWHAYVEPAAWSPGTARHGSNCAARCCSRFSAASSWSGRFCWLCSWMLR